jgi:hypothetical protein
LTDIGIDTRVVFDDYSTRDNELKIFKKHSSKRHPDKGGDAATRGTVETSFELLRDWQVARNSNTNDQVMSTRRSFPIVWIIRDRRLKPLTCLTMMLTSRRHPTNSFSEATEEQVPPYPVENKGPPTGNDV